MQRYFIQLAYDGTQYHGWQIQPNGITVQEVLEKALTTICRQPIGVTGAGRTDTGVHASFYVAHFDAEREDLDGERMLYNVNSLLPHDISVQSIFKVREDAHARFDATSRMYHYYISRSKNPFNRFFSFRETRLPDIDLMNQASQHLMNYSDFTSFSRLGSDVKTNICRVECASWEVFPDKLVFTIRADRFLRNMVRAIVGTLLEVGFGKLSVDQFCKIIEAKDRGAAGASAAANGLFLADITYPAELSTGLKRDTELI